MGSVLKVRDENGNFIGIHAIRGTEGKSAYEQAVEGGYAGTEEEFIALLNGLAYYKTGGTTWDYTVNIPGVTTLTPGTVARIIPHDVSSSPTPTLDVNGLGAKQIRRYRSDVGNSYLAVGGFDSAWIDMVPIELVYDGTYWIAAAMTKPYAGDLSGVVSVKSGGTGADNEDDACKRLGTPRMTKFNSDGTYLGDIFAFDYFIAKNGDQTIIFNKIGGDPLYPLRALSTYLDPAVGNTTIVTYEMAFTRISDDNEYKAQVTKSFIDNFSSAKAIVTENTEWTEVYGVKLPC